MRSLSDIHLEPTQRQALQELRAELTAKFPVEQIILFGSVARGQADEESDLDLLLITPRPISRDTRDEITEAVFYINLRHDTNFSTLVVDRLSWDSGMLSVMPIHEEIIREGVLV